MHRWTKAAPIRQMQIESGTDITFNNVFLPYYDALLNDSNFASIIDIGCGTGHLTKILSAYGARVVGIDPSKGMADTASKVVGDKATILCTAIENYSGAESFDLAISHLCLHTTIQIDNFLGCVKRILNPSGLFIFSIPHPCFWNNYKRCVPTDAFNYMDTIEVEATLTITKDRVNEMIVPYVHRPLSSYFCSLAKVGFTVQNFDEIFPSTDIQALYGSPWYEPRYVVFKVMLPKKT